MTERPLCKCHGLPKVKDGLKRGKQQWKCKIKKAKTDRKYNAANPDKRRVYDRKYNAANRDKRRVYDRKYNAASRERIGGSARTEHARLTRMAAACEEPNPLIPRQTRAIIMLAKHGSTFPEREAARKILRKRGLI